MDLVAGAMGNLGPKLRQLLQDEYKLQKGVKAQIESLAKELQGMHVALCKVGQVPYDPLDPLVKLWAIGAREASYDMEDILDTFLVRVDGYHQSTDDADKAICNRLLEKMRNLFSLSRLKARRKIAGAIKDIKKQVDEMTIRRDRYKVDDVVANSATTTSISQRESARAHGGSIDLEARAMGNLAPELLQLLQDKYGMAKRFKALVESLAKELEAMHVAYCMVAHVRHDQLDPQVKLWTSDVREVFYDMDYILGTLLVRMDRAKQTAFPQCLRKMVKDRYTLGSRVKIARAIKRIRKQVHEMIKRRDRYKIDDIVANSAATPSIDPHVLMNSRANASELVGIDEPRDALIKMLTLGNDDASKEIKIVSVIGSGGLGKTTLVKVVYEKLTVDMNISCKAFVSVGRNSDLKKVCRDILLDLDKSQYMSETNFMIWDERKLIKKIQAFLNEKRYFIVIDDIWEVSLWKEIRSALKDNNLGSKIMITTRRSDFAELVHCAYKIQPLHLDSSKILFYRRIFGSHRCLKLFSELSDEILKKCGGVPLAIITIASLLANKSDITEWQEVCSSIGSGLRSSNDKYNSMRKILALSYYDLPSPMKTCFLYLSMYPEDYEIKRDGLIWRWICEGFIQPQKEGDDLFELGKSYFNDLINRSLVQPGFNIDNEIYGCRVHDIILDLICSLSREENFVTTSDDIEQVKRLRRLSLKSTATWPKKGVSQVRSIVVFGPCIDSMPSFPRLDMLRVLDLEGCSLEDCGGFKLSFGNLIHLRYLGLRGTCLKVLPGGIEKLQFLQVLKMDGDIELPASIFELRRLMCLDNVRCCPRSGNLLSNLAFLQVLDTLYLDESSVGVVEALGHLRQLTVLEIFIKLEMVDQSFCDALRNSLGNLPRLQFVRIMCDDFISKKIRGAPPPHLWISPTSLPNLTYLDIMIHTVGPEDFQILGRLPNLVAFQLEADYQNYLEQPLQKFVISADTFPRLRRCFFRYVAIVPSMFTGAMPRVEFIRFCLRAWDFLDTGLDFRDLAMDHLPLLQYVVCAIHSETDVTGEEEAKELREAVKHAVDEHPKHPELSLLKEIGRV